MQLKIKKINSEAVVPNYAHPDDAGFDLYSVETLKIAPMSRVQVATGIALEIPIGYVGLVWDKSGLSHKHGLKTLGGVIDAGYRGEVKVGVINLGTETYLLEKGHKVAQIIIQQREYCEIMEVDELSETSRGDSGFGSTGK
jgi:dUTP pyrophosphatase